MRTIEEPACVSCGQKVTSNEGNIPEETFPRLWKETRQHFVHPHDKDKAKGALCIPHGTHEEHHLTLVQWGTLIAAIFSGQGVAWCVEVVLKEGDVGTLLVGPCRRELGELFERRV